MWLVVQNNQSRCLFNLLCFFLQFDVIFLSFQEFSDGISPIFITPETNLHSFLFPGKVPLKMHPHHERPVEVKMKLTLISIVDMESENEVIVLNANILQTWKNPNMKWNSENFDGIVQTNVKPEMTWVPDILVYANVENDKKYNGLLEIMNTQILVNNDGSHSWNAAVTLRMSCGMNIENYPFDTQRCPLTFGSLTMDSSRMKLIPQEVETGQYGESPEWVFISMDNETVNKYHGDGDKTPYTAVVYALVMRRKALYPMTMLILPNLLLAGLTILVFSIPIGTGERVMYIFTIFLAVAWYMTSNIETMPSSSQTIPLYTYFLGANLISLSLLCLSLCFTIACYYSDPDINKMPGWIRKNILGHCGNFFGISVKKEISAWKKDLCLARQWDDSLEDLEYLMQQAKDTNEYQEKVVVDENNYLGQHDSEEDLANKVDERHGSQDLANKEQSISNIFTPLQFRHLHIQIEELLARMEEKEDADWKKREWEFVTEILDKTFLYFFSSVLFLTVFGCSVHILQLDGY